MVFRALLIAVLVIVLDQLSKWAIIEHVMQPPRTIEVTGFFNLVLTFNTGVSFGLLSSNASWQPLALSLLAVAVSVALLVWLRLQPERILSIAVGLVVGGALGNVIDRLRFAAVVDFLEFHAGGFYWPAFNLADSAITIGVVLIVFDSLFATRQEGK